MDWETAIEHHNIPKVYREASLDNSKFLKDSIVDLGKRWLKSSDKPALFLSGDPGSGKTHFSYALLRGLIEQGAFWVIFVKSGDLDTELLKAILEQQEEAKIQKYCEVPYLFIDDLGTERLSDRVIKQYYTIIDHRMNNLMSTVFTSNLNVEKVKEILGDRISSRLEMTFQVKFPKQDIRKKLSIPTW